VLPNIECHRFWYPQSRPTQDTMQDTLASNSHGTAISTDTQSSHITNLDHSELVYLKINSWNIYKARKKRKNAHENHSTTV
jgi:hypothetical protein